MRSNPNLSPLGKLMLETLEELNLQESQPEK
jgi:hypothetical protein